METTLNTQAVAWIAISATYVVIIFLIMLLSNRKIKRLRNQLAGKMEYGPIESLKMLLQRISPDLTPADLRIVIEAANTLPVILKNGEFSYIRGLQKVIFTEMPINTSNKKIPHV